MYEKLKADVAFLDGDLALAAEMYHEGAREGDSLAAFNYGYCLRWKHYLYIYPWRSSNHGRWLTC